MNATRRPGDRCLASWWAVIACGWRIANTIRNDKQTVELVAIALSPTLTPTRDLLLERHRSAAQAQRIEQQQRLIDNQTITLEQLQVHTHELRSTHELQLQTLQEPQTQIDSLKAEAARLKQLPKKSKIRPGTLPKDDQQPNPGDRDDTGKSDQGKADAGKGKSPKPRKGHNELTIHKTQVIQPDDLPGLKDYTVHDLLIRPYDTRCRLARYQTPDGKTRIGVLPEALQGSHFGIALKSDNLYRYFSQRVTQPRILQQLTHWGIAISSGQISRFLTEDKQCFHTEKDE